MNIWQKICYIIGKIMEFVLTGMIGVSIVGVIANAINGQWLTTALPLAICSLLFYALFIANRKLTLFAIKCCSLTK